MFSAFLLAIQLSVGLPGVLEEWKSEIEARNNSRVAIVRLPGDPVPMEDRAVLGSYFRRPEFVESFSRSQALTFRYEIEGRSRSLILLNQQRIAQTSNTPAALISHELGHIWLASLGLIPPEFVAGPQACLAVHFGDIVQHMLIREESDRRGVEWRGPYARDYEAAYESLRRDQSPNQLGDACYRAQRLSLIVDVRSGFAPHEFPGREDYLNLLAGQDPEAEAIAIELLERLDGRLSLDKSDYEAALQLSKEAVYRLVQLPVPN
ncbi:hypothetical protein [Bryobacter aggregatus]|uniref:hypothetical protein n=1 Tax=Bryobacter aggregatus TaxID=360054 RepID=UPI0004E132B5|nr:hypothetical protein [Bryobacter aggregatus]